MDTREFAIQSAIQDLESGVFTSQRQACKAWGINRSTLQGRLAGQQSHAIAHQHQQRLSPEQEDFVVEWILDEDSRAQPPSHARVREMATRILRMNGDHDPLGQLWITHFLTRQPRVASIVGRSIEAARAEAATPELIRAFIELFERTRVELNIRMEDIWNMDETGIALGVCTNSQVIASSRKKKAYVKAPGDREWVSIIETVSATGQMIRCLVIFKGKNLQTTWFPSQSVPDWLYTTSENGWTSNEIGSEWLKRIFIPETDPGSGRWRLLILDGHGSHIDIEFMWLCKQHRIWVIYLPPHASHILQPLDLSSFSVIKSSYRCQIRDLSALDDAAPIKKERFVIYYNEARIQGLSERVIRAGWRAAGLCPYNPDLVLSSSQMTTRPTTPPATCTSTDILDTVFQTPQRSQDVYQAQQLIQRSESLSRVTRLVLGKAGKAISRANTRAAQLQAENHRLEYQLSQIRGKQTRKRVQVNPNERFSNVETIKAAVDRAAQKQAQKSQKDMELAASRAAAAASSLTIQSMCTEWQI
jgi:hypothetical protein